MICQLCLARLATRHVTELSSDDRFVEAQYCEDCYTAKYQEPLPRRAPRLSFTIKSFMILAGVWASPNAVTAWIMRSGWVTGTPAQVRIWTIQAFLAVNLVFGFFFVWFGLMTWFTRLMWHNQTGGLIPMPKHPKLNRKQRVALLIQLLLMLVPLLALQIGALILANWLAGKFPVFQRPQWFALISAAWLLPFVAASFFLKNRKNSHIREQIRQLWRTASWTERAVRAIAVGWTVGFLIAIVVGSPRLFFWGFTMWFPIPPVILLWVVVQLALLAAVALAAKKR